MTRWLPGIAFVLVCIAPPVRAQGDARDRIVVPNQAVYAEFGGNALVYSINLDRKLNSQYTVRVGYSRWQPLDLRFDFNPFGDQYYDSGPPPHLTLYPVSLNRLIHVGSGSRFVEIGAGMVLGERDKLPDYHGERRIQTGTISVGYRYTPGIGILRLGLVTFLPYRGAFPSKRAFFAPAVSFGITF